MPTQYLLGRQSPALVHCCSPAVLAEPDRNLVPLLHATALESDTNAGKRFFYRSCYRIECLSMLTKHALGNVRHRPDRANLKGLARARRRGAEGGAGDRRGRLFCSRSRAFSILEARVNLPMSEWRIETVQASRAYVSIKFGKLSCFLGASYPGRIKPDSDSVSKEPSRKLRVTGGIASDKEAGGRERPLFTATSNRALFLFCFPPSTAQKHSAALQISLLA